MVDVGVVSVCKRKCRRLTVIAIITAHFLSTGYKSLEIYVRTLLEVGITAFLREKR